MSDTEMIDWLEAVINKEGAILLHDGKSNPYHILGLGLRPGFVCRTLRQAITQAAPGSGYAENVGESNSAQTPPA